MGKWEFYFAWRGLVDWAKTVARPIPSTESEKPE